MSSSLINVDNLKVSILEETGINCSKNSFFLQRIYTGMMDNAQKLTSETAIKKAIYNLCGEMCKCTSVGIDFTKDFDVITPIWRGGIPSITISVEAIPRLLARRGWLYQPALFAIPAGGKSKFEEVISNGRRMSVFVSNGDVQPIINRTNLTNGTIEKFAIRVSIGKDPDHLIDFCDYIPTEEIIAAANASEHGIYKFKWESYYTPTGGTRKKRVLMLDEKGQPQFTTDGSPWEIYTSTMVRKVCLRRIQKTIRETFPELSEILAAADTDASLGSESESIICDSTDEKTETQSKIEKTGSSKVDFSRAPEDLRPAVREALSTYKQNPALLIDELEIIAGQITENVTLDFKRELANTNYIPLFIAFFQKSLYERHPDLMAKLDTLKE